MVILSYFYIRASVEILSNPSNFATNIFGLCIPETDAGRFNQDDIRIVHHCATLSKITLQFTVCRPNEHTCPATLSLVLVHLKGNI